MSCQLQQLVFLGFQERYKCCVSKRHFAYKNERGWAKTIIITSASSDVGCSKKSLKEDDQWTNRGFNHCLSVSLEMCFSYLGGIVGQTNAGIGQLGALKGLERERSRVSKAFVCTCTVGVSAPSLHRESTDYLISFENAKKSDKLSQTTLHSGWSGMRIGICIASKELICMALQVRSALTC